MHNTETLSNFLFAFDRLSGAPRVENQIGTQVPMVWYGTDKPVLYVAQKRT